MTYALIAIVAILAIAGVAWPLFRSSSNPHRDAREFAGDPGVPPSPADENFVTGAPSTDAAVEREIARYRDAVAAGTVCRKCGEANPAGAKFCADCGAALARDDEQEYA